MDLKKPEANEEEQAFLHSPGSREGVATDFCSPECQRRSATKRRRRRVTWWLRLLLDIGMAVTIVYLLVFKPFSVGRKLIRRTPVPEFPHKIYKFKIDPQYVSEDMWFNESLTLEKLHNWVPLSSQSRGYVKLPDDLSRYDLPKPIPLVLDPERHEGPGYMVGVFHQLHCLSYLIEHYQQGYAGVNLTDEVAFHSAHCFNYIRQALMCNADTTLEGMTEEGPGEGTEHECVDYDALLEWANENAMHMQRWRTGLVPEEADIL